MQWDDRIGRRLRLKDLHTLQTVAAVGSMAKASERLALSQPAISKAISDMEQTLGAPLFDRSSVGVELTECGRMLVARTRVIFDEVRRYAPSRFARRANSAGEHPATRVKAALKALAEP